MSKPRVRPARPGDVAAICRLFSRAFGRPLDEASWQWKLGSHAFSEPPAVWVAVDDDDQPICHYGGIPRTIALGDGRSLPAMVTVDGMTDPTSRRAGAFTATIRRAHEAWRQAGYACILGLPNERWGSRIEALDWRLLYPLRWYLRPLDSATLLAQRIGVPAVARITVLDRLYAGLFDRAGNSDPAIEVRVADSVDSRYDRLDPLVSPATGGPISSRLGLVRGCDWIHWRYLSCVPYDYEVLEAVAADRPVGYLAWRLDRAGKLPFGTIAETIAETDDQWHALLRAALRRMRAAGAAAAAALAIPGNPDADLFRRAGFRFSRGTFDVRCVPLRDDLPWDALRDGRRFTAHGGDFDVA